MFKGTAKKLVDSAYKKDIAKEDDIENYVYGINAFLTVTANIITALVIGAACNMLIEMLLFLLTYKTLRKYTGGLHAPNAKLCYISSCVIYIAVLTVIRYAPLSKIALTCMTVLSVIILIILSPVEAINKPLDNIEKRVFRRRSYIIISIWAIIFGILCYSPVYEYAGVLAKTISVTFTAIAILAICGKIIITHHYKN